MRYVLRRKDLHLHTKSNHTLSLVYGWCGDPKIQEYLNQWIEISDTKTTDFGNGTFFYSRVVRWFLTEQKFKYKKKDKLMLSTWYGWEKHWYELCLCPCYCIATDMLNSLRGKKKQEDEIEKTIIKGWLIWIAELMFVIVIPFTPPPPLRQSSHILCYHNPNLSRKQSKTNLIILSKYIVS